MKRVLLTNTNLVRAPYPAPPVGVCLVAAALEGRYAVRVYDGLGEPENGLEAVLKAFGPDYVGLGVRNIDDVVMAGGSYFVDEIRERFAAGVRAVTRAPLILGGAGFTIFPRALMEALDGDYGIVGEGEAALPALLAALDEGRDPASIPGVVCRGENRGHKSQVCVPGFPGSPVDMSRLPPSQIDLHIDYAPYRQRGAYPIQTKRGCAHRCLYCSYPQLEGRRFRTRPPEAVVDEIATVRERLGDVTFEFVDATFNAPPGHAEAICREIARRGLTVRLRTMGVNPAGVTGDLLDAMKAAGFAQIDCTPDSASPAMLEALRKNFTLDDLQQTAHLIREHDLPTMWFFLLGGPGESEATLRETFDFIDAFVFEEDLVHITEGLRIYPNTGLYEVALREGVIDESASLLRPAFYVSPRLGRDGLREFVGRALATRPNLIRASESAPPAAMLEAALAVRREQGLTEPMFRTLLRLRREARR